MYAGLIRPGQVLPGPYPKDLRGTQGPPAFGELPERLKLKGKRTDRTGTYRYIMVHTGTVLDRS